MPGFQYNPLTYTVCIEKWGMPGRRLHWWPILTLVALPHRVYQWVASVVDQILTRVLNRPQFVPSKWITVSKYPLARAERDPGDSPLGQSGLLPLAFPGTQPASCRIMSHNASTHKHPTTPWIDLYAGPFLDEELRGDTDDMRVQRGSSQVRCRVAWVRAWPVNVGVGAGPWGSE